jgi:N-acetylneuraminic acid mutarotase
VDTQTLSFSGSRTDSIVFDNPALCAGLVSCTVNSTFEGTRGVWTATSTAGAPDARREHTAVWTGSEMIVWGGNDGNAIAKNTGARFDPVTNTWTPMTTVGAPSGRWMHTVVWTGTEMIIWGGFSGAFSFQAINDGAKYNPQTDTWMPITDVGAPSARFNHTAVWTGTEMIIWGGFSCTACGPGKYLLTGARFNPATDTWTPVSASNVPSARGNHSAVWTDSKMIVWGGEDDLGFIDTGGIYDPVSDSWAATSLSDAPPPTRCHAAEWTGSVMIVFGGQTSMGRGCGTFSINTGALYDPVSDSWFTSSAAPLTFNSSTAPAVWSGTELFTWGRSDGARYNPVTDSWSGMSTFGAPSMRTRHSLVWTGSNMVVWGGGGTLNTGRIYDP